jgi:hypothetical protein
MDSTSKLCDLPAPALEVLPLQLSNRDISSIAATNSKIRDAFQQQVAVLRRAVTVCSTKQPPNLAGMHAGQHRNLCIEQSSIKAFQGLEVSPALLSQACPNLQQLRLGRGAFPLQLFINSDGTPVLLQLQLFKQLTHLSINCQDMGPQGPTKLRQLAELTNLQHLVLSDLPAELPPGVPCGLSCLTHFSIAFRHNPEGPHPAGWPWGVSPCCHTSEQLGHLAALRDLSVALDTTLQQLSAYTSLMYLPQLTRSELSAFGPRLWEPNKRFDWDHLVGLQSLALAHIQLGPVAFLQKFPQLRALSLEDVRLQNEGGRDPFRGTRKYALPLLLCTPKTLHQLTQLRVSAGGAALSSVPPASDFKLLTISTNLQSLQLYIRHGSLPHKCILFKDEIVTARPHLREVDLLHQQGAMGISQQQLECLCTSCPALETLRFGLCRDCPVTNLLPLLQLTALTYLGLAGVTAAAPAAAGENEEDEPEWHESEQEQTDDGENAAEWQAAAAAAAAAAVAPAAAAAAAAAEDMVEDVSQLTGLVRLTLWDLPYVTDPYLLQLSELTALTQLELADDAGGTCMLQNQVRWRVVLKCLGGRSHSLGMRPHQPMLQLSAPSDRHRTASCLRVLEGLHIAGLLQQHAPGYTHGEWAA